MFDYDKAEATALEKAFEDFRIPFDPACQEEYREINRRIWQDFEQGQITAERLRTRRFELLFEAIGRGTDPQAFSPTYLKHLAQASDLMDGCTEIVQKLGGKYRLAVITNGLADVQRSRFSRCAIRDYISVFIISEEVGAAKPDPAIFDAAFERMGRPQKETVLMIGDSLTGDIQGGIDYGLDTCWFNPSGRDEGRQGISQYEIRHLSELADFL